MTNFEVVLASGAEHLRTSFTQLGCRVHTSEFNFDGKRFFPNTDLYVRISQVEALAGRRVVVVQSCTGSSPSANEFFTTSDRLQELILLLDLLRNPTKVEKVEHKTYKTKPITPPSQIDVVLTFQPFALQDKAFSTGEAVSSAIAMKSIADLSDGIWVVEPVVDSGIPWVQKLQKKGMYNIISIVDELVKYAAFKFQFEDYVLTAPDEGAGRRFGLPGFSKRRSDSFTIEMQGEVDVRGQNVLVLDDLTKSGKTLLQAKELLISQGAKDVGFVVIHVTPIRDGGEELLDELVTKSNGKIVSSNTVYTAAFCEKNPELVYDIVAKMVDSLE